MIFITINLQLKGEWDRYLKKPTLKQKEKLCEASVNITWELETKEGTKEQWNPKIFHNRFEDYDRSQISLFRAYENKRNLIRIAKVMAKNIQENLEFLDKNSLIKRPVDEDSTSPVEEESYDKTTCATVAAELKELETWQDLVKEALAELDIPEGVTDFKEALDDPDYKNVFLSYQNKPELENLKKMNDFVQEIPNATQVFYEDDSIYREELDTIWGPEIYWKNERGQLILCP